MNKLAAAATAITLLLAAPAMAQRPLGFDQLPTSGVVNYKGTLTSTDFTASIQFQVDSGAGTVTVAFTIRQLVSERATTPPLPTGGSGNIDAEGGFLAAGGFSGGIFIANSQASFLAGNFFQGRAKEIAGVFITQYCFPATTVPCAGFRTRPGSYEATRVS
jgi:hypothetical protein